MQGAQDRCIKRYALEFRKRDMDCIERESARIDDSWVSFVSGGQSFLNICST
jgi:hypothetical protein